jgi:hypothetical protein
MPGGGHGSDRASGRVLFEFTQLGQQMRVAAVDEATGTEVVVIAPVSASRIQMQNLAVAKLRRRIDAEHAEQPTPRLF